MEKIFETIFQECSKQYESYNAPSYFKVFNAFLKHITSWLLMCNLEIKDGQKMQIDDNNDANATGNELSTSWLDIINTSKTLNEIDADFTMKESSNSFNTEQNCKNNTGEEDIVDNEPQLARHITMIKSILELAIKFVSSSTINLQILSLECLTFGIPLLHDYENELLPLIHTTWSPFVEKFRQKNAIVLNRCYSLLEVLAVNAKDFITKRSLE